jgi:glutaredoxin-like protein NrdH
VDVYKIAIAGIRGWRHQPGNSNSEEKKMEQCPVKLYALSTCIHCKNAKDFLNQCGVNTDCVDVDKLGGEERKKILEEIKRINPECAFPTIVVGDKVIVGFKKDELKEVLGIT